MGVYVAPIAVVVLVTPSVDHTLQSLQVKRAREAQESNHKVGGNVHHMHLIIDLHPFSKLFL